MSTKDAPAYETSVHERSFSQFVSAYPSFAPAASDFESCDDTQYSYLPSAFSASRIPSLTATSAGSALSAAAASLSL